MTMVAACAALSMNAQMYVGGSLGLNFENKLKDNNGKEATGMSFQIKPEVGYVLDENSALGIVIGFGTTNNGNTKNPFNDNNAISADDKLDKSVMTFEVAPYYRYNYLKFGNVNLFVDGQFDFTYFKQDNYKATQFGLHVIPGVAVNLNDNISFVAKMGEGLGWSSCKVDEGVPGVKYEARSKFGLDVSSLAGLQFGMYYNF